MDSVIKDEQMKQIRELQDFVKSQPATITEFEFTVDFKSGITIDIVG